MIHKRIRTPADDLWRSHGCASLELAGVDALARKLLALQIEPVDLVFQNRGNIDVGIERA